MFNQEIKDFVEKLPLQTSKGVVIYTDGSHDKVTNLTGGGIHGYIYTDLTKKQTGLSGWVTTQKGYKLNSENTITPVEVVEYIDCFISSLEGTNNTAELKAGIASLVLASELAKKGIKNICILMDSQYVINGLNDYLDKWAKNNWKKSDGASIANLDLWKTALECRNVLKELSNYEILWVKGHNKEPGNETADKNALIGRLHHVTDNKDVIRFKNKASEGFWKPDVSDKTTLINGSIIVFDASNKNTLNNTQFKVFSNDGNEISMYGISDNTACYGIIRYETPPAFLNSVLNHQFQQLDTDKSNLGLFYSISVRNLYSKKVLEAVRNEGVFLLKPASKFKELKLLDYDEKITEFMYPMLFAIDGLNHHQNLKVLLDRFLSGELEETGVFNILNVTDIIYKPGKVRKVDDSFCKPGSGILDFTEHFKEIKSSIGFKPLLLSYGSDLPRREIVAAAGKLKPEAHLIVWNDDDVFKRAFVLKTTDGVGIWFNPWRSIL